jgi:hypothetical protein
MPWTFSLLSYTSPQSYSDSLPTLLGSLVALDRDQLLPFVQFLRIEPVSL